MIKRIFIIPTGEWINSFSVAFDYRNGEMARIETLRIYNNDTKELITIDKHYCIIYESVEEKLNDK